MSNPTGDAALPNWSFLASPDAALAPEWQLFTNTAELNALRNHDSKDDLMRATRSLTSLDDTSHNHSHNRQQLHLQQQVRYLPYASAPGVSQNYVPPNNGHPTHDMHIPRSVKADQSSSRPSSSSASNQIRYDAQGAPSSSSGVDAHNPTVPTLSLGTSRPRKRLSQAESGAKSSNKRLKKSTSSPEELQFPSPSTNSSRNPNPLSIPRKSSPVSGSDNTQRPMSAQSGSDLNSSIPAASRHSKPALLSQSQKKANHIQSEQKRRANIRRGYEALCEIVPALREAIKAEEDAALASFEPDGGGDTEGDGAAGVGSGAAQARKKARGKAVAAAFGVEEGEKVDGRAGPRSEAVVLQKTIEHVGFLETQRTSLIDRIQQLRTVLPASHPALSPLPIAPSVISSRRAPFIPPPPDASQADFEAWNEGSAAPEFDSRQYDVPPWSRVWDGGTGLPIPGMGLVKLGMVVKGSGHGRASSSGHGGGNGNENGGGAQMDEDESDEDL